MFNEMYAADISATTRWRIIKKLKGSPDPTAPRHTGAKYSGNIHYLRLASDGNGEAGKKLDSCGIGGVIAMTFKDGTMPFDLATPIASACSCEACCATLSRRCEAAGLSLAPTRQLASIDQRHFKSQPPRRRRYCMASRVASEINDETMTEARIAAREGLAVGLSDLCVTSSMVHVLREKSRLFPRTIVQRVSDQILRPSSCFKKLKTAKTHHY